MAVFAVNKMWSRFNASQDGQKMNIESNYQVFCDPDTTLPEIYQHPDLPLPLQPYGDGVMNAWPASTKIQRISPVYYIITYMYEGVVSNEVGDQNWDPISITWASVESDEPIDRDWNGQPIVNALGDPVEGVTVKISDQVATISRTFLDFSSQLAHQYLHSTNSDTFLGYPPGVARMVNFTAQSATNGRWNVNASIHFRMPWGQTPPAKAWYARVRHEGYYERDNSSPDGKRRIIIDGEGATRPQLLKADGTRESNPYNAYYLYFQRYASLPFSVLGLI
jgi:hypothetical protein